MTSDSLISCFGYFVLLPQLQAMVSAGHAGVMSLGLGPFSRCPPHSISVGTSSPPGLYLDWLCLSLWSHFHLHSFPKFPSFLSRFTTSFFSRKYSLTFFMIISEARLMSRLLGTRGSTRKARSDHRISEWVNCSLLTTLLTCWRPTTSLEVPRCPGAGTLRLAGMGMELDHTLFYVPRAGVSH